VGEPAAKALAGKRVVLTRAAEQCEPLIRTLRERGAIPIVLPLVAFAPPDNLAPLDEAIGNSSGRYDWLFLTSQNAVRALEQRSASLGLPLAKALEGVSIAAVGPATAQAARNAGLEVAYVAAKHQGTALARELAPQVKGKKILLPRSDRANRDVVETLARLGAQVTEVVAYRTIAASDEQTNNHEAVLRNGAEAVLFFSPSAVHLLLDLLGRTRFLAFSQDAAFTAIGPVTEKALQEAGVRRIVVARDSTVAAALEVLSELFSRSSQGLPAGVRIE
jgi:uroporphyrinogen III methyltransferase / synthase